MLKDKKKNMTLTWVLTQRHLKKYLILFKGLKLIEPPAPIDLHLLFLWYDICNYEKSNFYA